MDALITVAEALARVLARAERLPAERLDLAAAAGRILAEAAVSPVDLPPFRSSAMDGYAVRAADLPGTLSVVDHAAAGRPAIAEVGSGEAIEISTGGVVPPGADTVVPVERVVAHAGEVEVREAVVFGDNVREVGRDVREGATVLEPGELLTPARLAALAACGVGSVLSIRRPRVALVVTGTELRPAGETLRPGEIYESNGILIAGMLEDAGAVVERAGATEDTRDAHFQALEHALRADVVVTSGGVSMGPHDLVRRVEGELGVEEVFWGVAMRPGKPLAFGVRGSTLVFGLPGNPVSSLVGCLLFVRPALLALQGHPDPAPPFRPGILATDVRQHSERDDFVRARVTWTDDGALLHPTVGQESHMIVRTTAANAIVHIPRGTAVLAAGSRARFLAF